MTIDLLNTFAKIDFFSPEHIKFVGDLGKQAAFIVFDPENWNEEYAYYSRRAWIDITEYSPELVSRIFDVLSRIDKKCVVADHNRSFYIVGTENIEKLKAVQKTNTNFVNECKTAIVISLVDISEVDIRESARRSFPPVTLEPIL